MTSAHQPLIGRGGCAHRGQALSAGATPPASQKEACNQRQCLPSDQDSQVVAAELDVALSGLSQQLAAIPSDAWARPALRSNGSRFTLATLIRYLVHDPVHHAHDVCGLPCSGPGEPLPARGTREG